jgi:outer membrane protein insertion porin family
MFCFLSSAAVRAQETADSSSASPPASRAEPVQFEVLSISFTGNDQIPEKELRRLMVTRETPGWFDKFLYRSISERLGRRDEFFNPPNFWSDLERLKKYYVNRGFDEVRIDTAVTYTLDPPGVNIAIAIHEGYRSIIDTIIYRGIRDEPGTIWQEILANPFIQKGDPFNRLLLEEEVKRVLRILNDTGYPNAVYVRDSSSATRYTSTRNYTVKLAFAQNRRYRFGDITIVQEVDSARGLSYREDITDDIILATIDYAPGDFYSLQSRTVSERHLNKLGIFDLRSLTVAVPAVTDTAIMAPSTITYLPSDRHEVAPELIVSDEDGAFNIGAGLGYVQRNFLGGGRLFSARARFRTQTLTAFPHYFEPNSDAVSNLDFTLEVQQPYVFTNRIRGSFSISTILDKQIPYRQLILRSNIGLSAQTGEFTTTYVGWALEAVDLTMNQEFDVSQSDPETQRQVRSLQPRSFNSILSFTTQRDKSNDLFSPSGGFVHALTLEEAGLFPLLLSTMVNTLPYTQFYRVILTGRWYEDITENRFTVFATKAKVGFEGKYGNSYSDTSRQIPQTHRFFAGGGNSVRGWNPRELIASGNPQLGGNLLLELSVEWRVNILQALQDGLWDKLWLTQFIDAGNVWVDPLDFRLKQFALATGLGLRYDTFFGPFRLDWGLRIYDPAAPEGNRWITQRKFWTETVTQSVLHFGIGHAF